MNKITVVAAGNVLRIPVSQLIDRMQLDQIVGA